MEASNRQ